MKLKQKTNYLLATLPLGGIEGVGGFTNVNAEPGSALESLISTLIGAITAVAGIAFILYFVLGAFGWITAGGDKTKVESAQKQITNALMGLVIVVVAYFIISIVGSLLGLDILNPAALLGV
jgi:hypothetical protein